MEPEESHAVAVAHDPFAGSGIELTAPTTDSQREIWAAVQMGPEASCAFNETNRLDLRGPLDVHALRTALAALIARHEALRSTFSSDGENIVVADFMAVDLPFIDLGGAGNDGGRNALADLVGRQNREPFDLFRGPLLRAQLVRLAEDHHALIFTGHHSICDGWSTGVLMNDLAALYSAKRTGVEADLEAPFPFSAYAFERRAAEADLNFREARTWWLSQFAEAVAGLDLPADNPRPAVRTYGSDRVDRLLGAQLTEQVRRFAARSQASVFVTLLAAFEVLLHRLSASDDLVVGFLSAGQASTGHLDLVGHAVNTLPLKAQFVAGDQFGAVVARVRSGVLDAVEHADFTFGRLLGELALTRDPSRLPLVSVLFNLETGIQLPKGTFAGLDAQFTNEPRSFENFELFLNTVDLGDDIRLECQYNKDLYTAETIRRWLDLLALLLGDGVAHPTEEVDRLSFITEADRAKIAAWNATDRDYPRDRLVHELFQERAQLDPHAVAAVAGDQQLTYRELDARADELARRLAANGVTRNDRVGLCLDRSLEMLVGLIAVAKAGAAYVPLDPTYPRQRIEFMVRDARLNVIVSQESWRHLVEGPGVAIVSVDAESAQATEPALPVRPATCSPEDPLYVIYTSGSTGLPKGVQVPHRAVVNYLTSTAARPGMTAADVVVAVTTLSFDIAVTELWLPLVVGARVVVASREEASDGALLLGLIRRHQATFVQATPSTWRLLISAGWDGDPRLRVLCGGEGFPADLARDLTERSAEVWNMYGPTETTVWSSAYLLPDRPGALIPIGTPIANTQLHVLDANGSQLPIGVPGELYIGGDGVTSGYHDRPDLTAARFLPDAFRSRPGGFLYRTGDLARWRTEGVVEYLGRTDTQVKLRGYRIELGEIEAALAALGTVSEAAVLVREDSPGDARLIAYVISQPGAEWSPSAMRDALRTRLPSYMLPQQFVQLTAMPLTPNGKVDRRALPSASGGGSAEEIFVAPSTPAEKLLAAIYEDVLHLRAVSVHDDFFLLGGHSLLAAQVCSRLVRDHDLQLSIKQLFQHPTIAALAPQLSNTEPVERIPRQTGEGTAPASLMQRRFWLTEQFSNGAGSLNLPAAWRLDGDLDVAALKAALAAFVRRHDSTRTSFRLEGEELVQVVAAAGELDLPREDFRSPGDDLESALRERLLVDAQVPFDLATGPLFRVRLFRIGPSAHVLFFVIHHAIWDGWTFDLLLSELDHDYRSLREGGDVLGAPPIQYADFARWQRGWLKSPAATGQRRFWDRLLEPPPPDLELPTDRPRDLPPPHAGKTRWVRISAEETASLEELSRREGTTVFQVLLTAYSALLHRYSGQPEFVVGVPVRGRSQPEAEAVAGAFINDVVVPVRIAVDDTFRDLLARVRATLLECLEHAELPFESVGGGAPAGYRALFSFQDVRNRPTTLGDLAMSQIHVVTPAAPTDIALWILQNPSGLVGGLNFSSELFDDASMGLFQDNLHALLRQVVEDPGQPVGKLLLATGEPTAVAEGDGTAEQRRLHDRFDELALSRPDAPAIIDGSEVITYGELDHRARVWAAALAARGTRPGDRVAVLVEAAGDRAAALVALARAALVAVPLHPRLPKARIERILAQNGCVASLVDNGKETGHGDRLPALSLAASVGVGLEKPGGDPRPGDPALLGTTSGAGGPVGALLSHGTIAAAVDAMARRAGFSANDRLLATTDLASGRSVLELWLSLSTGGALLPAARADFSHGPAIQALLARTGATAMHADPGIWRLLFEAGWSAGPEFKAIAGGAPISAWLRDRLASLPGPAVAVYGMAEAGYWAGLARVSGSTRAGDLGDPVAGSSWYIVDGDLRQVAPGMPGELVIAGGIALGLTGCPGSSPVIVPDNQSLPDAGHLLRIGDRVRARPGQAVQYLGRLNGAFAINGLRAQPAEIESALARHAAVRVAAMTARDSFGELILTAHFVAQPGVDYTETELRRYLRSELPAHMIPRQFSEVTELPLASDGSVDRDRLLNRLEIQPRPRIQPRTDAERLLASIWRSTLGLTAIGVDDNFFELGGHSLLCLQALAQVEAQTGARLSPRLFLFNTLEQLAARLGSG